MPTDDVTAHLRVERDLRRRAEIAQLLLDAARSLNETLEIDRVYDRFHELLADVIQHDGVIVSSFDERDRLIRCEYASVEGNRIDIRGANGVRLKDKWKSGPQTYLGVLVEDFPNMMMLMGPHTALGNIPRSIEYSVDWVTGLIRFARDRGLTRVEATAAGSAAWTQHVIETSEGLLFAEVDSWMTGINRNVEGK